MKKIALYGLAACAIFAASTQTISAGNIRLSNGQFIQGDIVGEPTDKGLNFKLTSTGGQIFLRWSQLHADDAKRLKKVEDPDANLKLVVQVKGARVDLVTGESLEGRIEKRGSTVIFNNLKFRNREIALSEIDEGGLVEGVMIDATSVMEPDAILQMQLRDHPPVSPQEFYEFARLCERLGLYQEARAYVEDCLAALPSPKLQSVAEALGTTLDELIKQEALLQAVKGARDLARKRQYQAALTLIDDVVKQAKPSGAIEDKLLDTRDEIDAEFTQFVIREWYAQMNTVATKAAKDMTVDQAMGFARGQMEQGILAGILAQVGSEDQNDIKTRFDARRKTIDKLSKKRAAFGADGWYDVVGGPLPSAGNMNQNNPNAGSGGRNAGAGGGLPGGFPGAGGAGGGGRNRGGQGGGQGGDRDGHADAREPDGFQNKGGSGLPEGIDPGQIEDLIRRAQEAMGRGGQQGGAQQGGNSAGGRNTQRQDADPNDPRWQVPENTPALRDWWTGATRLTKRKWLIAYYVLNGRTMMVVEQKYDVLFYK